MRISCLVLSLCALGLVLPPSAAQAELIAHYTFDGDTDDVSGNGNDAFADGDAQPSDGPGFDGEGGAFSFGSEGAGGVVVPLDVSAEAYPDMTITMWVKPDAAIVESPGLYKVFGHDDGGWDRGFGLDNRAGEYRYAAFTGGARPGPTPTTGAEITDQWTFLAAVYSTENDDTPLDSPATVTFYAGSESLTAPINNTVGQLDAAIGAVRPDNFAETWRGLIDDVRIYDTALDVADIDALRFFDLPDVAGDVNGDRVVDMADYDIIQANMFQPDPLGDPRLGDLTGDNFVDFADFRVWKDNASAADAASVPEPSAGVLIVGLMCMLASCRQRRS